MGFKGIIKNNNRIIKGINFDPAEKFKEFIYNEPFFQDFITQTIGQRIKSEGTDSRGEKLRTDSAILANSFGGGGWFYSPANKDKKNQSFVDLYDSGYLFNSMSIIVKSKSIVTKVDIVGGKDTSVYKNFELSYKTKDAFKDIVFSLDKSEINELNKHLMKRMDVYLKNVFNYD